MELPKDKAALLDWLHRERADWEALMEEVGEENMLLPGAMGDWTFKDAVAHLTFWRRRTIARFMAALHGTAPPEAEIAEEVPKENERVHLANRDRPLPDVLAESRRVWQELEDAVNALPQEDLMTPGRFEWIGGEAIGPANLGWSFDHLHEHEDMIRAWHASVLGA